MIRMSFGQAITSCLSNYATTKGRASRSEYWYFFLFYIIVSMVIGFIIGVSGASGEKANLFSNILTLLLIIPTIAVSWRRMQDLGKSGWFCVIPIYNIILAAQPGQIGDNDYGPDPLNIKTADQEDAPGTI